MGNQIVIQDDLSMEGMRILHLMSNDPPAAIAASPHLAEACQIGGQTIPAGAEVKLSVDEISMYHLVASWPAREAMYLDLSSFGESRPRRTAIWRLDEGQRISEGATEAALLFFAAFEYWPSAAWVRVWPTGLTVEQAFIPIRSDCGMDLFAVPWTYERCVLVGGGFHREEVMDG